MNTMYEYGSKLYCCIVNTYNNGLGLTEGNPIFDGYSMIIRDAESTDGNDVDENYLGILSFIAL